MVNTEIIKINQKVRQKTRIIRLGSGLKTHPRLKLVLILALLILLTLSLSACGYPGQDTPCTGSQKNAPGCAPPVTGISDLNNGGDWYIEWAFKIVRDMLSNFAIQSVKLGVSVFWNIYTNLSSTDFAWCRSGNGGGTPTCAAVDTFNAVRTIAFLFFPLLIVWKFTRSYFLGGMIESFYESAISFLPKFLLGAFVLAFLDVIMSGAFGLSNILFNTITGGADGLNSIAQAVVGHGWDPNAAPGSPMAQPAIGVASVGYVKDVGLMIFVVLVCAVMSIVFMFLGIIFLLRTVIIFILFGLSPLAVVAGLNDEFRSWFGRWLENVQAMLIAPIPVAICLRLVLNFAGNVPSAHDNPPEFLLNMVYIISFLAIGAILMFKMAAQVGGMMFGLVTAGIGFVAGTAVGRATSRKDKDETETSSNDNSGKNKSGSKGISTGTSSSASSFSQPVNTATPVPTAGVPLNYNQQQAQQQDQMLRVMRSMTEALKGGGGNRSFDPAISYSGGGRNGKFSYRSRENAQSVMRWAGFEAGVTSPYLAVDPGMEIPQPVRKAQPRPTEEVPEEIIPPIVLPGRGENGQKSNKVPTRPGLPPSGAFAELAEGRGFSSLPEGRPRRQPATSNPSPVVIPPNPPKPKELPGENGLYLPGGVKASGDSNPSQSQNQAQILEALPNRDTGVYRVTGIQEEGEEEANAR